MLGPAELLIHYGTDLQKDFYLPRLARGEEIPCFGKYPLRLITEAEQGLPAAGAGATIDQGATFASGTSSVSAKR